ncbi:MAG: hypothetical protein ACR2NO_10220, partial [Chloroflexota bacterium]
TTACALGLVPIGGVFCCDQAVRGRFVWWRGVRTPRYTYARSVDGPWVLYDNQNDPYQLHNLVDAADSRPLMAELEAALQVWLRRLDDDVVPAADLFARLGLTGAWAAREAHFHPPGVNKDRRPPAPPAAPSVR